jgi:hypothetical protein
VPKGNKAEIEGTMKMSMTAIDSKGEMGPKGKTHKVDLVERSHEVWEKTAGGWKLKTSNPLPGGSITMDGKVMPMGPPPTKPTTKPTTKQTKM